MLTTPCLLLTLIFLFLGTIHFYWAVGGKWGFEGALPTTESGKKVLNPKAVDCVVVGLGLFSFGTFYFFQSGLVNTALPISITRYVGWIIPAIFFLRAMGDLKYVGFFKRIRNTSFTKADTRLFAPLCLIIALLGVAAQWLNTL